MKKRSHQQVEIIYNNNNIIIIIYSFRNHTNLCGVGMEGERSVLDVVQEVSYPDRRGDEAGQRDA